MNNKKVRNKELYYYIVEKYITSANPVSQKDIAEHFEMSLGAVKNFMYRHELNKKSYYKNIRSLVRAEKAAGTKVCDIAKKFGLTEPNIYMLLKDSTSATENYKDMTYREFDEHMNIDSVKI